MIRSMTAFASAESSGDWGTLHWELRAVNHRYLDVSLRLPEELRGDEAQLRNIVTSALSRGKVDCTLRLDRPAAATSKLIVNDVLLDQLVETVRLVSKRLSRSAPLSTIDLMRWPGVLQEPERDLEPLRRAAAELLQTALERLDEARESEGGRLRGMVLQRCSQLSRLVDTVRDRLPEVRSRIRERILTRLQDLPIEPDENRLEQELVVLTQKMDVDEELDRLQSHLVEISSAVDRTEPVGRRLDFLMQELNREANTLSSKSQDITTTRAAVDMKVLIEQMREQVQNIQ